MRVSPSTDDPSSSGSEFIRVRRTYEDAHEDCWRK
jgi:hypothetical protein